MVMHKNALFIRNRKGIYYFVRRVLNDMKSYYSSDRISFSLKTKSYVSALRIRKSATQRLEDYRLGVRLQNTKIPSIHFVKSNEVTNVNSPNILEALKLYLKLKGVGKDKTFIKTANRNVEYIIQCLGNKTIPNYSSVLCYLKFFAAN